MKATPDEHAAMVVVGDPELRGEQKMVIRNWRGEKPVCRDSAPGDGRVARPFGFAPTDPSVRLSRTRLFPRVGRVIQREPPASERYVPAEGGR